MSEKQIKDFYRKWGFREAGNQNANPDSLQKCLSKVFGDYREKIRSNADNYRSRIKELEGQIKSGKTAIQQIENDITPKKEKIEALKEELHDIETKPEKFEIESEFSALGFTIGSVVLVFLTAYLLLFYSSAFYSAFFKNLGETLGQLSGDDLQILFNTIFDPKALQEAKKSGMYGLIFTIIAPILFLATGFLLYVFFQKKQSSAFKRFSRIGGILLFVFGADVAIAYKITQEIYEAKVLTGLVDMAWKPEMVLHDVNFYLVLVAGFAGYLIWGGLLGYVAEEYNNSKFIKAVRAKRLNAITHIEEEIEVCRQRIAQYELQNSNYDNEIQKLIGYSEAKIISIDDLIATLNTFVTGWTQYINTLYGDDTSSEREEKIKKTNEELEKYRVEVIGSLGKTDLTDTRFE